MSFAVGVGVEAFEEGDGFGGVGGNGGEAVEDGDEVGGGAAGGEDGKAATGARHGDVVDAGFVGVMGKVAMSDVVDYYVIKFKSFGFMDGYDGDEVVIEEIAFVEGAQFGETGAQTARRRVLTTEKIDYGVPAGNGFYILMFKQIFIGIVGSIGNGDRAVGELSARFGI